MKKVLFRGKRELFTCIEIGEWVYGYFFKDEDFTYILESKHNKIVIPETVGQYTGKNDIQGNEIFGGDIVSYENNLYEVFYDEKDAAFCLKRFATMVRGIYNKVLVIGNRTDNPELLEKI